MPNLLSDAAIRRGMPRCFNQPGRSARRRALSTLLGLSLVALFGCGSKTYLMPTPNAYTHPDWLASEKTFRILEALMTARITDTAVARSAMPVLTVPVSR
jgi:hypothetical protein